MRKEQPWTTSGRAIVDTRCSQKACTARGCAATKTTVTTTERKMIMGDIGTEKKTVTFEPFPGTAPEEAPAAPVEVPAEPVPVPA